jgi:hypothetical protein
MVATSHAPHAPRRFVLAADVGGTHSRFVVRPLTAEGARGAADAGTPGAAGPAPVVGPGANIRSNGPAALDHLPTTAQQALDAAGVQSEPVMPRSNRPYASAWRAWDCHPDASA